MKIPQDIKDIHQIIRAAGKQLFVVGGCVRDHYLGLVPDDYDMATDAMPDEIIRLLDSKYMMDYTGRSFGVIRVWTKDSPKGYEIATFREDVSHGRQPEVRLGATIGDDVKRRDFTINALFYDLDKNEIVDLVGGLDDIKNKILRCVGVAVDRFNEDRLRVLRAIRFAHRFGFTIDKETVDAIRKCHVLEGLDKDGNMVPIVRERINEEMFKASKQITALNEYFNTMYYFCILSEIIPGHTFNDVCIDSKCLEVIIASMYHQHVNTITLEETLSIKENIVDLKIPTKMADGIELLLAASTALRLTKYGLFEHAYPIAKRWGRLDNVTEDDMSVFLKWVIKKDIVELYSKALTMTMYRLSVTGQELLDEGMSPGSEMGEEIKRREQIKFNTLLQLNGRTFRDNKN